LTVSRSRPASPQPHENPNDGWTANTAASSQEIVFGKPCDRYISIPLLIANHHILQPFIEIGKVTLCGSLNVYSGGDT
jgi:hypothetical protein